MSTRMMLDNCEHSLIQIRNAIPKLNLTLHKNIYAFPYIYGKPLNKNEHSYEEIVLVEDYLYELLLYVRKILEVRHNEDNYIMDQMFENQTNYMWNIKNIDETFINNLNKYNTTVCVKDFHGTLTFYFELVYSWK